MSLPTIQEVSNTLANSECEAEPIHIPGAVQPFGILLVVGEPELQIVQISLNAESEFGWPRDRLIGAKLADLFVDHDAIEFEANTRSSRIDAPNHLSAVLSRREDGSRWTVSVHRWDGVLLLECQRSTEEMQSAAGLQVAVRKTISDLNDCKTLISFCQSAAEHFRHVTGFDRVLIYRFLEDHSGSVIAESRTEDVDSFLSLRYPASDIPAQARSLYLRSSYRLTADVDATLAAIYPSLNPKTGRPLDLSYCALRATSPFHLEYLRNMGVQASLSFSIVREGTLWGLVACHHRTARFLSEDARAAGEILAHLLGFQVGIKEEAERKAYSDGLRQVGIKLAGRLRDSGDFARGLMSGTPNLLTAMSASGVALCTGSKIFCLGKTPDTAQIEQLRTWLQKQAWQPVWSTDNLCSLYEPACEMRTVASGVLAVQLAPGNPELVFWFRPELVEVVKWAGNPNNAAAVARPGSVGPKRSFELWQEQVRNRSVPWNAAEHSHAAYLRDEMSQALLKHRALEIGRLNAELLRTNTELERFAAIASHDLQEPLRTVTMQTELLFRQAHLSSVPAAYEIVGFVRSATERMSRLVSALLEYAQTGGQNSNPTDFPMQEAVRLALDNLQFRIAESGAVIRMSELPFVLADKSGTVQLMQNLLSNALKYCADNVPPFVEILTQARGDKWLFTVADHGLGFDPALSETIFEPFRRLHGREVSGSGLGLAISRRIVERSGGEIWAESQPGVGSKFMFTLPAGASLPSQPSSSATTAGG